jgi:hypothetical protein
MGAMRRPSNLVYGQLFRRRQTGLSVCDLKAPADSKAVNRPDIRAAEIETMPIVRGFRFMLWLPS